MTHESPRDRHRHSEDCNGDPDRDEEPADAVMVTGVRRSGRERDKSAGDDRHNHDGVQPQHEPTPSPQTATVGIAIWVGAFNARAACRHG
jgi:hypothetical protein